ncbi:MarC family protein, partial [Enterobacter hormaechei]|uniref:MarC family protein n=1 Tax=Enterobacter hormaechei TaxID=158836 RepID=UPI0019543A45
IILCSIALAMGSGISFGLNMLATRLIFKSNEWFIHYMGQGGLKAMSRIFSLFLAAIAISLE